MSWKELPKSLWPYFWRAALPFIYLAAALLLLSLFRPWPHREAGLGQESVPQVRTR